MGEGQLCELLGIHDATLLSQGRVFGVLFAAEGKFLYKLADVHNCGECVLGRRIRHQHCPAVGVLPADSKELVCPPPSFCTLGGKIQLLTLFRTQVSRPVLLLRTNHRFRLHFASLVQPVLRPRGPRHLDLMHPISLSAHQGAPRVVGGLLPWCHLARHVPGAVRAGLQGS